MKRAIYLFTAAVFFVFISASNSACLYMMESEDGNGNVVKQERDVSPFRAIRIGGAFEVSLIQGEKESLVIEADENLMEFIRTEVDGHTLIVETEKNLRNYDRLLLYITFRELEQIDVSGAVNLYGDNRLTFGDLTLETSGATEVTLDLEASSVSIGSSGASHLRLDGRCTEARLESSGASELKAGDLETEKFTLNISGAGEAVVFVTNTLDVNVSGAAHVKYRGSPQTIHQETSGASSISRIE
jgi:hypothetical protein